MPCDVEDDIAPATPVRRGWWRLLVAVLVGGVLAGLAGAALTLLLHGVQWLAYGFGAELLTAVDLAPHWRRVLAPTVGCLVAALTWWWLARRPSGAWTVDNVADVVRGKQSRPLQLPGQVADAVAQIVLVGSGASLGREGAPRQVAAALSDVVARRAGLDPQWRSRLVAAAAGAGLAAVYGVPLAGAVYAVEVVAVGWTLPGILVALPMALLATVIAQPVVGSGPVYDIPALHPSGSLVLALVPAVFVWAAVGLVFTRAMRWATARQVSAGAAGAVAVVASGLSVGLASVWMPEIVGNGQPIVQLTLGQAAPGLWFLVLLMVAKTAVTGAHLAAGARGGLLTPALAVGAAAGGVMARQQPDVASLALVALLAAAAVLAVAQNAPVFAALFVAELCRPSAEVWLLLMAVTSCTWIVARLVVRHRPKQLPDMVRRRP